MHTPELPYRLQIENLQSHCRNRYLWETATTLFWIDIQWCPEILNVDHYFDRLHIRYFEALRNAKRVEAKHA